MPACIVLHPADNAPAPIVAIGGLLTGRLPDVRPTRVIRIERGL